MVKFFGVGAVGVLTVAVIMTSMDGARQISDVETREPSRQGVMVADSTYMSAKDDSRTTQPSMAMDAPSFSVRTSYVDSETPPSGVIAEAEIASTNTVKVARATELSELPSRSTTPVAIAGAHQEPLSSGINATRAYDYAETKQIFVETGSELLLYAKFQDFERLRNLISNNVNGSGDWSGAYPEPVYEITLVSEDNEKTVFVGETWLSDGEKIAVIDSAVFDEIANLAKPRVGSSIRNSSYLKALLSAMRSER